MSSTLREIRDFFLATMLSARFWAVFVVMVGMFAAIGPFGTYQRLGFPARVAYWSITMTGSWLITVSILSVVMGICGPKFKSRFLLPMVGILLASFPVALFLNTFIRFYFNLSDGDGYWIQWLEALPVCIAFGVILSFVLGDVFVPPEEEGSPDDNALINRLPVGKRGQVKHMSMQDHYIHVTTTRGKELVLMRMADAVSALGNGSGLQVHRSHWVNKDFVSDARRENGQPVVVMDDGVEYPVSRSYVKAAREAGII